MTTKVELNTNINTNNALNMPNFGNNTNNQVKPKSIFDLQPSVNNYDNDFMASGVNFASNSPVTSQVTGGAGVNFASNSPATSQITGDAGVNASNSLATPQFAGTNATVSQTSEAQKSETSPAAPKLNTKDTPEETSPVSGSSKYSKTGTVLGFLAPIAANAIDLFKGKTFARAFNLKQLAVTAPLLALAGFGIGAFVDSCLAAKKAKAAAQV